MLNYTIYNINTINRKAIISCSKDIKDIIVRTYIKYMRKKRQYKIHIKKIIV